MPEHSKSVQTGSVPILTRPTEMPDPIAAAVEVLGSRAKLQILYLLSRGIARSTTALAVQIGISRISAHRHLTALEKLNIVSASIPDGERDGKSVIWDVNPDILRELPRSWERYALGEQRAS